MRFLLLAVLLTGCAVKGYDLGWRKNGALTASFGTPLDPFAGCRLAPDIATDRKPCQTLRRSLQSRLDMLAPATEAAVAAGARCDEDRCTYADVYERRDVGTAVVIVPILKRIVLREGRVSFALQGGSWQLISATIRDSAPPGYGPVRVGASPVTY